MRGALGYGFPRRRIKPLTKRRSPKLIGTANTEASHGLIEFFTKITRTNNHTEPYRFHDRIAPRCHSQCNSSVLRCHALNRSHTLTPPPFGTLKGHNSPSAPDFKPYSVNLPHLRLDGATHLHWPSVVPTLDDNVQYLAYWLRLQDMLGYSPSPNRFSAAQDSKTARLPPTIVFTTGLLPLRDSIRIIFPQRLL
jgi:hypothetical protein